MAAPGQTYMWDQIPLYMLAVVLLGLVIGLMYVIISRSRKAKAAAKTRTTPTDIVSEDPIATAKKRLAAGEITAEEYDSLVSRL